MILHAGERADISVSDVEQSLAGLGLPGTAKLFQDRMKVLADTVPNGKGTLHLIPGLGHVPHLEDAGRVIPPLVAFLKAGVK